MVAGCSATVTTNLQLKIEQLSCNHLINPLGIDDVTPLFSWQLRDTLRGQRQTAYRIRVAGSEESLEKGNGDIWDSGKIAGEESIGIPFQGKMPESGKRYFWNVQVWDIDGNPSATSETAFFETGLLNLSDWKAKWISAPTLFDWSINDHNRKIQPKDAPPEPGQPAPLLRKEFNLRDSVSSARIYITGLGFFELSVNGEKVSDHFMDPAFTDYTKTVLYKTFDITDMLRQGSNVVGVMLGNGWYNMLSRDVWSFDYAPWRDRPVLFCQVVLRYHNGGTDTIPSDLSWKCYPGPVTFNSIRQGESIDHSLAMNGWDKPGLDDSGWYPVRIARKPLGSLKAMTMPSIRIDRKFKPVSIRRTGSDRYLVDFGQAMAGFVKMKVTAEAGTGITVKYGELVDADSRLDQSNIDGLVDVEPFQTDVYITGTDGSEEEFYPRFSYSGFRYVEITGYPGTLRPDDISACSIHTSFKRTGSFECSNEILNKIQHNTIWSFISNYHGYPTDCPHREKNGWTGDAQLASETGLYNFDMDASYLKWLGDLIDAQHDDGMLPGIAPTAGWGFYWGNGPAWDHALFAIPWNTWVYAGDIRLLQKAYPAMKKYMGLIRSKSKDYLLNWGLGDWCPARTTTPEILTSTAYFLADAEISANTAGILGLGEDSVQYRSLADSIKTAFREKLFDPETGLVGNGSQTAQSTALYFNILDGGDGRKALEKLLENLDTCKLNIDVGILGAKFMLNALSNAGRSDVAYSHIVSTGYPGWANWVKNGATTLWENWNGEASRIHIMYGDISAWLYKNLVGIKTDPEAPGFRHFVIDPYIPPDLEWVKGSHQSPNGLIRSSWQKTGNGIRYDIGIPVNSTASVKFQNAEVSKILLDNKPVQNSEYLTISRSGENTVEIELGSGNYSFMVLK